MAFTTIQGSGATDATTYVGTAGVDSITINASGVQGAFAGAQLAGDTINVLSANSNITGYTLKGGQGTDTVAALSNASYTSSFLNGNSDNDTLTTQALFTTTVMGGQGADTLNINGLAFQSLVNGNKNNDVIASNGMQGATLYGGQGNDTVNVAANTTYTNSTISLDKDNDSLAFLGAVTLTSTTVNGKDGNDTINAAGAVTATSSTIFGGQGTDSLLFANAVNAQNLQGEDDNDIVTGGAGNDIVDGGSGNDAVTGGGGNDTITGGVGVDNLTIGAGTDRIVQGAGQSATATVGAANLNAGSMQANATITFGNGIDIITDGGSITAADTVVTGSGVAEVELQLQDVGNLALGNYTIQGTYVQATGVFTQANAGLDVLVLGAFQGNLATAANITNAYVVQTAGNQAGGGLYTFA